MGIAVTGSRCGGMAEGAAPAEEGGDESTATKPGVATLRKL